MRAHTLAFCILADEELRTKRITDREQLEKEMTMEAGIRTAFLLGLRWSIIAFLSVFVFTGSRVEAHGQPFPPGGIDQFTSIFNADIEVLAGPLAGQTFRLTDVTDTAQTVVRSDPFFDGGPGVDDMSVFPVMPVGASPELPSQMRDSDLPVIPDDFNEKFAETVHLQMTSLNAVSADGQFRILAGQAILDQLPDVEFKPSYGIAYSVGDSGFPARSFFIPYAVVVTPFGNLVVNHTGYERVIWAEVPIEAFPQQGGSWTDDGPALLLSADDLDGPPVAQLTNLVHTVLGGNVGGTTELLVGDSAAPAESAGSTGGSTLPVAAAAGGLLIALAGGGLFVRRRLVR